MEMKRKKKDIATNLFFLKKNPFFKTKTKKPSYLRGEREKKLHNKNKYNNKKKKAWTNKIMHCKQNL